MNHQNQKSILVVSATGTQGRAITKLLLKNGFPVRILVRNPDSPAAQELIKAGAEVSQGDLSDPVSIEKAVQGINAVYSILPLDFGEENVELNGGKALIQAAKKAGVQQFVHASVANAGTHESFPRWGTGYWNEKYWIVKWQIEQEIQKAGFPYWTILKPVSFMENLLLPLREHFFPKMKEGKLFTAQKAGKKWDWVTVEDTAKFGLAAFNDPERFNKLSIDLASDSLTLAESSAIMTKVLGKKFDFIEATADELIANGIFPFVVRAEELYNEAVVYTADLEQVKKFNVPLTSFEEWLNNHKEQFTDVL